MNILQTNYLIVSEWLWLGSWSCCFHNKQDKEHPKNQRKSWWKILLCRNIQMPKNVDLNDASYPRSNKLLKVSEKLWQGGRSDWIAGKLSS